MQEENNQRENNSPTMDPGEGAVLFIVVLVCMLAIAALMVRPFSLLTTPSLTPQMGTAWMFGARFDRIFADMNLSWPGGKPAATLAPHEEL